MTEIPQPPDQSDPEQVLVENLGSLVGKAVGLHNEYVHPDPDAQGRDRLVLYTDPKDPNKTLTISAEAGMDPNGKFNIVYAAKGALAMGSCSLLGMPGRRFAVIHPHPRNKRGRDRSQVRSPDLIEDLMAAIDRGTPERPASPEGE